MRSKWDDTCETLSTVPDNIKILIAFIIVTIIDIIDIKEYHQHHHSI